MNMSGPDDNENIEDGQDSGETDQPEVSNEPLQPAPLAGRSASNDNIVNK
jgi:hypothetical protein